MSRNRRRHQNKVPIRALSPCLLLAGVVLVAAMTWVYFKNQLFARGEEITRLERQLKELKTQNDSLRSPIATLSSRIALQKKLSDGFIQMIPIPPASIVKVNYSRTPVIAMGGDEIVSVSNPGAGR